MSEPTVPIGGVEYETPPLQTLPAEEIPPLPEDATPEQKDAHWYRYVYQGDRMPQLTLRAVLMGGCLGMVMSAANLYTTLTIGWSFGVTITACVISYLIFSSMRWLSGGRISQMSILENNCMASTASAAGASTGAAVATMFGALLMLTDPQPGQGLASIKTYHIHPWWLIGSFTLLTALMGVFLAIPMKRQMINHERLRFPSGIATAETLKSLYSRSREALHKAYALLCGLFAGALLGVLTTSEGTLKFLDSIFNWFYRRLHFSIRVPEALPDEGFFRINGKPLYGFFFEPSLMLIGAGMITGLRVSLSMLAGSALLYFVFVPWMIHRDLLHAADAHWVVSIPLIGGQYKVLQWGLWGGTALMVFSSLTALALQWKTVARAFAGAIGRRSAVEPQHAVDLRRIEVPTSWMILGMVPIGIGMLVIQRLAFGIAWWAGLIAVGMAFVLAMVASRSTGETDTTPIGAMGKVMQLLFAVLSPGSYRANLAPAGIGANSASSSADLLTDLKSGYVLGANPRRQFLAQFLGVFFGTLAIVPIWYLMVPDRATLESYTAPATRQWFGVAQVLTKGLDQLANSAKVAILVGALLGVALPVIEKLFVPPKYRKFWPSAMGLGLSWVVGFSNALSFAIGATFVWLWERVHPKAAEKFSVPLASGFVAGESLIKAMTAMARTALQILGH